MTSPFAALVKAKLESNDAPFYPTIYVEVIDNTAGSTCENGAKLEVIIVSDKFDKVPLIQRHRMVNECLEEYMPKIHALSMKTWTNEQYKAKQQS